MKPYNDTQSKGEQVRRMFDTIAPRYDLLNHTLSMGVDYGWRRKSVKEVCAAHPARVLDVATGTGDMAIAIARKLPEAAITGVDLSDEMLAVGRRKIEKKGLAGRIALQQGDASALAFADGSFDAVCAAFGVRNFENLQLGISEMGRVLTPGGKMVILEFSVPRAKIFSSLYRFYFHKLLPRIGGAVSGDGEAYSYLPGSVDEFPAAEEFLKIMQRAGLHNCMARSLLNGVAYIYTGEK